LLRVSRRRLADEIDGVSVAQVRGWQAVAELLEIDGMTLAVAEQLHARGVETLDELANRPLSGVREVVNAMGTDGVLATVPTDDELAAWKTDAVHLRNTGTLNGTVIGTGNTPITGVSVACMGQAATSDARG